MTRNVEAMRKLFTNFDVEAQIVPLPGIFPDYPAPIIRNQGEALPALTMTRWGMPTSRKAILDAATKRADKLRAKGKPVDFDALLAAEPDKGPITSARQRAGTSSPWLGVQNRCLVPFSSFSEFDQGSMR